MALTSPPIEQVQYLYIVGRLLPDNRLELLPSFLTDDARGVREDPKSPLVAELYDKSDHLLLRYRIPAGEDDLDGTSPGLAVRGKLPFPAHTRILRFYRDTVLLHEMQVSATKPNLTVHWEPPKTISGVHRITWEATHAEGKPLHFFLRYSHSDGKVWQPASFPTAEMSRDISFDALPGGPRCRIMVVATDGINTVTAQTRSFHVPIKPCRAMVFSPKAGARLAANEPLILQGQGFYLEENKPETEALVWSSSIDGELGTGMTLAIPRPSPGSHQITLTAGIRERTGRVSVTVHVSN